MSTYIITVKHFDLRNTYHKSGISVMFTSLYRTLWPDLGRQQAGPTPHRCTHRLKESYNPRHPLFTLAYNVVSLCPRTPSSQEQVCIHVHRCTFIGIVIYPVLGRQQAGLSPHRYQTDDVCSLNVIKLSEWQT